MPRTSKASKIPKEIKKLDWKPGTLLNPVPAIMVSCGREGEKPNIITLAWAGTINSDPPMVSISIRKERYSHKIISETGAFVVNLVTQDLLWATDFCGVKSGKDVDKFAEMHLTAMPGDAVQAPYIHESPLNMECKVTQVIPLGTHDLFLAEVMATHVNADLIDAAGALHLNSAKLVCYNHGLYQEVGKVLGYYGYSVRKKKVIEREKKSRRKKDIHK